MTLLPANTAPAHREITNGHPSTTVALLTLGCPGGFRLVDDPEDAETVVVNTCGFVEAAKKDSVETLLAAAELKTAGTTQAVVAVGCMAERYGHELAVVATAGVDLVATVQ